MRPSPARAVAPEPDVWIPILDLELLAALGSQVDPLLLRELDGLERSFSAPPAPDPQPLATPLARLAPDPEPDPEPAAEPAEPSVGNGVATHRKHHGFLHWLILALGLAVVVAGVPYFLRSPAQRRVTLEVDGASFTRTTRVENVGNLLTAAGVSVAAGDQVTPDPATKLRNGATVHVVRAFPVTVDVNGSVRSIRTTATTMKQLRRELAIPTALVVVGGANRVRRDDMIVFRTPFDVSLITDGVAGSITSTARTVGELLTERGVAFVSGDLIDPPPETPLSPGLAITITHTSAGRVTEDTIVPFEVHEHADASSAEGTRHVVQAGVDGTDRTTYQLIHDGDAVVAKQPLGTVRVRPPHPEIVAVGTQPIGGAHETGVATWYATLYQPGTCAHLHIPFGTVVRVTDTDTGASTTCRVADRGPEAYTGKVIDLSPDVFEQLQPLSVGELNIRLDY